MYDDSIINFVARSKFYYASQILFKRVVTQQILKFTGQNQFLPNILLIYFFLNRF